MSYVIAAYAVTIGALAIYVGYVERERASLLRSERDGNRR